jgi:hypothetical protein
MNAEFPMHIEKNVAQYREWASKWTQRTREWERDTVAPWVRGSLAAICAWFAFAVSSRPSSLVWWFLLYPAYPVVVAVWACRQRAWLAGIAAEYRERLAVARWWMEHDDPTWTDAVARQLDTGTQFPWADDINADARNAA